MYIAGTDFKRIKEIELYATITEFNRRSGEFEVLKALTEPIEEISRVRYQPGEVIIECNDEFFVAFVDVIFIAQVTYRIADGEVEPGRVIFFPIVRE